MTIKKEPNLVFFLLLKYFTTEGEGILVLQ